jgi:hypothetical protein
MARDSVPSATTTATTVEQTVEQTAVARVVNDEDRQFSLAVTLRYEPAARAVQLVLPSELTPRSWTFTREQLESGLRTPTGAGEVRVWPCGRAQTVIEVHSPQGVALMQFDTAVLRRFLVRTHTGR